MKYPFSVACQLGAHTLERQCTAEMACVQIFAISANRRMATRCERNCYLNAKVSMASSTLRDDEPEEAQPPDSKKKGLTYK
jgi:hypothetical protein